MAKKTKTNGDLLKTKVKHTLTFKLTDAEKIEKHEAMLALEKDSENLEAAFDDVKDEWKSKILAKYTARKKIRDVLESGEEKRTVECTEERDYAGNAVRYFFKNELMEERAMSAEERQTDLALKPTPLKRKKYPGNGDNPADFKKAAAGDRDDDDSDGDNLTHVIRSETSTRTKHNSVDGPMK